MFCTQHLHLFTMVDFSDTKQSHFYRSVQNMLRKFCKRNYYGNGLKSSTFTLHSEPAVPLSVMMEEGSPSFTVLDATESWAGPGNEATLSLDVCKVFCDIG